MGGCETANSSDDGRDRGRGCDHGRGRDRANSSGAVEGCDHGDHIGGRGPDLPTRQRSRAQRKVRAQHELAYHDSLGGRDLGGRNLGDRDLQRSDSYTYSWKSRLYLG